jgi:hypothetical protein
MITYFDAAKAPLIAKGIELIDQGLLSKTYHQFAKDLY